MPGRLRGGRSTAMAGCPAGAADVADREEISIGLHTGESFTAIAARLQRAVSTVSREVAANGGRGGYRAWRAHQRAVPGPAPEDVQAGLPAAGRPGHRVAATVVVAGADLPTVADRVSQAIP